MKKTISLVMTIVLCLSLWACNGAGNRKKAVTKEELLENAFHITVAELQKEVYQNRVKAKQTYCGVPIAVSGTAMMIEEELVVICDGQVCLDVYLPIEELAEVESGDTITVVGIIDDIKDLEITWGGVPFAFPHYIMELGYLVD